jgi:hypothetical protein
MDEKRKREERRKKKKGGGKEKKKKGNINSFSIHSGSDTAQRNAIMP